MPQHEAPPTDSQARATWISPGDSAGDAAADLLYELPASISRAERSVTRLYRRGFELRARISAMGSAVPLDAAAELSSIEAQIQTELRKPSVQLDEFAWMIRLGVVLAPYVDPKRCVQMVEASDALSTCIAAMATNVGGHGFELVPALSQAQIEALSEETRRAMDLEKIRLENFFNYSSPNRSFTELRDITTRDKETCGFGGWELIEREMPDEFGTTNAGLEHMPAWSLRLTPLSDFVEAEAWRLSEEGQWEKIIQPRRFRLVVQIIEGQYRYFKQFGDPRVINRFTGAAARDSEEAARWKQQGVTAGSCLFFSIYHALSPYGAPRWLGAAASALGRRLAQQVNLAYFDNKAIPPLAVLVSGGGLTEESMQALTERFRNLKGVQSFHDILVIETLPAQTNELDPGGKTNVRVELKPLSEAIEKEGLFKQYQEDAREDVRTTFRLPSIVTGLNRDYNFATADASMRVAEQQVFQPERNKEDFVINHLLLPSLGARYWRFRTKPARTSDEQAATSLLSTMNEAGALTPNEIRTIGAPLLGAELPQVDEPWASQPFQLTLVQSGASAGGIGAASAPQAPADAAVELAKKLILTPPDGSEDVQEDAADDAAEPAADAPRPPSKEVAASNSPRPGSRRRARRVESGTNGSPRFWRMQLPASATEGAEVVNGIIRLNEQVQAEIARRWKEMRKPG